ncbi:hypothetical protein GYH30_040320 [Glycine max]|nr:hypothetical protein GYH30_040320 [Glycine max]
MQSQGLALPQEPLVGPSGEACTSKKILPAWLPWEDFYEGSTVVHNTPLLPGQVKVGVEEVKDPDVPVPVPTDEVSLVGQAIHTFLAWPTHLETVSPAKPPQNPDPEVDDSLYLMTLTIPELFLRPYQKHLTETSIRAGNSDLYGFLEPQSIQRSGQSQFETKSYIKSWMQSSKRDVYLRAYLNGGHWQMVVIMPKEHLVVWFCSLHNRSDNYLKEIINSALKGADDAPQPKSKAPARWIVIKYFNDPRQLKLERLKALRIHWAQYYLRVRAES